MSKQLQEANEGCEREMEERGNKTIKKNTGLMQRRLERREKDVEIDLIPNMSVIT